MVRHEIISVRCSIHLLAAIKYLIMKTYTKEEVIELMWKAHCINLGDRIPVNKSIKSPEFEHWLTQIFNN